MLRLKKMCERRPFARNWLKVLTAPASDNCKPWKASIQGVEHYHPLPGGNRDSNIGGGLSHQRLYFLNAANGNIVANERCVDLQTRASVVAILRTNTPTGRVGRNWTESGGKAP